MRESETCYHMLVEQSPETMLVHCQGKIVYINPAGVKLFGATCAEDLIDLPIRQIMHPDFQSIEENRVTQVQDHNQEVPFIEERLLRLNGDAFWAEVATRPITYQGHVANQTVIHDISARKEAEEREKERIVEREKTRALEEFINDISHDFRTPLTVINTYIYLLQKYDLPQQQQQQLALIRKHSTRLMTMVEDMFQMFELDLAKDFQMSTVDLAAVLQVITTDYIALAAERNQTLWVDVPDIPQMVWGNKKSLERVIVHLVANALQFTPEGGTINVRSRADDSRVCIEVNDSGIGITEQDMPHIFKRFFRANRTRPTAFGGSGLGLTIAKKIIERHQGYIEVSSVVDKGSLFRVVLPRHLAS